MTAVGVALLRRKRRTLGFASLMCAIATVVTLESIPTDSPGTAQRIFIAVMTLWAGGVAVETLARRTGKSAVTDAQREMM